MLESHIERCDGRTARGFGGAATITHECADCERRTCRPQGITLRWMKPPAQGWCVFRIDPDEAGLSGVAI